jgi:hypothetical protein
VREPVVEAAPSRTADENHHSIEYDAPGFVGIETLIEEVS